MKNTKVKPKREVKFLTKSPGSSRYPWEAWFARGTVRLARGKDFFCQPHGLAMTARHAAKRHGVKVIVNILDDTVTITVRP